MVNQGQGTEKIIKFSYSSIILKLVIAVFIARYNYGQQAKNILFRNRLQCLLSLVMV